MHEEGDEDILFTPVASPVTSSTSGFITRVRHAFYGLQPADFYGTASDPTTLLNGERSNSHMSRSSRQRLSGVLNDDDEATGTPMVVSAPNMLTPGYNSQNSKVSDGQSREFIFSAMCFNPVDGLDQSSSSSSADADDSFVLVKDDDTREGPVQATTLQVCAHSVWESQAVSSLALDLTKSVQGITRRSCCYIHEIAPPQDDGGPFGSSVECVPKTLRMSLLRDSAVMKVSGRMVNPTWKMLIAAFIFTAASLFLTHTRDFTDVPAGALLAVTAFTSLYLLGTLLNYSTAILLRLMLSFDVWLLLLWSIILTWCDSMSAAEGISWPSTLGRIGAALLAVGCFLLTDAVDVPRKRLLGLMKLGLALAFSGIYVLWRLSYTYPGYFKNTDARREVDVFGSHFFKVRISTIAQCGAATMACFAIRFAYRKLFNRSDSAILQFGATTAPHHRESREGDRSVWLRRLRRVGKKSFMGVGKSFVNASRVSESTPQGYGTSDSSPSSMSTKHLTEYFTALNETSDGDDHLDSAGGTSRTVLVDRSTPDVLSKLTLIRVYITMTCTSAEKDRMKSQLEKVLSGMDSEGIKETILTTQEYRMLRRHRHFVPRKILLHFDPRPLVAWPWASRIIRHPNYYPIMATLFLSSFVAITALDAAKVHNTAINLIPRLLAFSMVFFQILFGLSVQILKHEALTLEFWFLALQLPMAIPSSFIYYRDAGIEPPVLVVHAAMLLCNAVLMASCDTLLIPRPRRPNDNPRKFMSRAKGITFLFFAIYAAVHMYTTQKLILEKEDFRREVDLGAAVVSIGSLCQATSFNLFIVEMRMVFQYFVLQQDMVLMSFPTHEEEAETL